MNMAETELTEGGGMNEYLIEQRKQMGPRNISPEVMGQHKAQVFNAILKGGFSTNPELAGWAAYSNDKKKLLVSAFESIDDIFWVLNHENDNGVLEYAIAKKRELEIVAQAAGSVPK
jgi:hypothetical protein